MRVQPPVRIRVVAYEHKRTSSSILSCDESPAIAQVIFYTIIDPVLAVVGNGKSLERIGVGKTTQYLFDLPGSLLRNSSLKKGLLQRLFKSFRLEILDS